MNWHDSDHRSSSAAAYLTPVESIRTNWLTLTGHLVGHHTYIQLTKFTIPAGDKNNLEGSHQSAARCFWCLVCTLNWRFFALQRDCQTGSHSCSRSHTDTCSNATVWDRRLECPQCRWRPDSYRSKDRGQKSSRTGLHFCWIILGMVTHVFADHEFTRRQLKRFQSRGSRTQ